jgi:hypothetical protein
MWSSGTLWPKVHDFTDRNMILEITISLELPCQVPALAGLEIGRKVMYGLGQGGGASGERRWGPGRISRAYTLSGNEHTSDHSGVLAYFLRANTEGVRVSFFFLRI